MGGCKMTTLAPDRAGPAAEPMAATAPATVPATVAAPETARRAPEPADGPGRRAGGQRNDSGPRAWLRRKAGAAWMNVLIAGTVAGPLGHPGGEGPPPRPRAGSLGIRPAQLL